MSYKYPKISVITAHRDDFEKLTRLLACMEQQTVPFDRFEWIIIDDGSTTDPPSWFQNYDGQINLVPVVLKENQGRAKARNTGIKRAKGEIIVFIDSDMTMIPSWLEILVRGVIETGGVLVGRRDIDPSLEAKPLMKYLHSRGAMKLPQGGEIPGKYFSSCNSAMERHWIDQAGGFDETFEGWGGEDLDLGISLEKAGAKLYYESRARTWHNHFREWEDVERMYIKYGCKTIPRLLEKHPEVKKMLSLDAFDEFDCDCKNCNCDMCKKCLARCLCKPVFYRIMRWKVSKFKRFPWPDIVFDYMIFFLYSRSVDTRIN